MVAKMPALSLIRHGQASFGAANYDQLSALGYQQGTRLGEAFAERGESPTRVFIGGMLRHKQTAEACLQGAGIQAELVVHAGFTEFNHEQVLERFEPRFADRAEFAKLLASFDNPHQGFASLFRAALMRWVDGHHNSDYDESWRDFQARCNAAVSDTFDYLGDGESAWVFTSGGCISVVAQALLELSDATALKVNWTLANGGLTQLSQGRLARQLISLNEHGHYAGRHRALLTYR